ncbi:MULTISPECIES: hypothetical protein [Campylobacter]|nr:MULTISPECIES: hypothetical protein [Campylobacter]OEW34371.1 hypothetical protein AJ880_03580 [Campylobacter jejuni]OEW43522.1 hypothetical protein AJ885_00965 [Campylobacter sp. BCW_6464]
MKKIILFLLLFNFLFAEGTNNGQGVVSETTKEEMQKIFPNSDDDIDSKNECSWECRKVNSGYGTQIIGFDFKNGTTFCRVYKNENFDLDLKFNASKTNLSCAKQVYTGLDTELKNYENIDRKINLESIIKWTPSDTKINFAKYLVALATLNPNIIDREKTYNLGELTLKDGIDNFSIKTIQKNQSFMDFLIAPNSVLNQNKGFSTSSISLQEASAVDGFNKNNMAYFSNLFLTNEKIYQHLQILILVLVGGFFLTSISAEKIQAYLENRGENEGKQKFLHKFYIPMIMMGIFFMPIPEGNGLAHSTIMQNVIRYFALKSTDIADMASAIGGKTYMDKIYKSIGGVNIQGIKALLEKKKENEFLISQGDEIYKKTCSLRYKNQLSAIRESYITSLTDEDKEKIKRFLAEDSNDMAGKNGDISLEACIALEADILKARNEITKINSQMEKIDKLRDNTQKINEMKNLDAYFAVREMQLGWINSLFTPSSAILAEVTMFKEEQVDEDEQKERMIKATKKNIQNTKENINKGDIEISKDDITDSSLGWIAGKLVWMMLPGASTIKDFVMENTGKFMAVIQAVAASTVPIIGTVGGAIVGYITGTVASTITGYAIAIMLIEWTFQKIPLLVCTTASIIIFVSYLVSLIKYFYISPFVVAFSLATKRMDKIIEFLINGMAIFLKPVLIILFIYLSLFINVLVDEFFLFVSVEQFTGIKTSVYNFHTNFIIGAITGLLTIFAKIASAVIMWNLIIKGPSWALSLVGIDGKQSEMISQGMENTLNKRANIV